MAQAQTTPKRTNCPNCGAKLPEQPLSLCSYCAMPLDLADGANQKESKNTARIQKVPAGKGFEEAMEATPPESAQWMYGWRMAYQGRTLLALALPLLGAAWFWGSGSYFLRVPTFLAYVVIAMGITKILKGGGLQSSATEAKLLKRHAMILDRRSETTLRGWGGDTRYFFELEFEDGGVGEFGMHGRGTGEEPFPSGMFGVAYTRGEELLDFKQVRV
ncbi:MAG: hypothetical protein ACI841_004006 [Planctomycetota bacterium]|jgi:hypothetical protein